MDAVAWLLGTWSVDRAINGRLHAFTGTASFTRDGTGGVHWHETGRLVLHAHAGPAARTLAIVAVDGGHEVRFDDGRPFHPWTFVDADVEVTHRCGPDLYRGVYRRLGPDDFAVTWHVDGPGHADVIASRYARHG